MKKYELVHRFFGACAGNQKDSVTFREIETHDPDAWFRANALTPGMTFTRATAPDGSIIFDADINGRLQRYTFTEL